MNETSKLERSTEGSSDYRLVRPRRETPKWIRLSRLLDEIRVQVDCNAIHEGFVCGKTKELDAALSRIIYAATEAKKLLRPNT